MRRQERPRAAGTSRVPPNSAAGGRQNTGLAYLMPQPHPPEPASSRRTRAADPLRRTRPAGVEYLRDGARRRVHGDAIVLFAGAFKSPQLLTLSGVGPADELARGHPGASGCATGRRSVPRPPAMPPGVAAAPCMPPLTTGCRTPLTPRQPSYSSRCDRCRRFWARLPRTLPPTAGPGPGAAPRAESGLPRRIRQRTPYSSTAIFRLPQTARGPQAPHGWHADCSSRTPGNPNRPGSPDSKRASCARTGHGRLARGAPKPKLRRRVA
jgi:hypothetical protein